MTHFSMVSVKNVTNYAKSQYPSSQVLLDVLFRLRSCVALKSEI